MANTKGVFRKVSLDRLSSPEQLDQRIIVVSPKGVFALAALSILIAIAAIWGFTGKVSNKITGQGMLLYGEGISSVISPVTGGVTDLSVQIGDVVEKGQILARVSQPEGLREIESLQEDLIALDGISPDGTIDMDVINYKIYSMFADLAYLANTEKGEFVSKLKESIDIYRKELEDGVSELINRITANSIITASVSGTVLSLDFSNGDYVGKGQLLATIARETMAGGKVVSNNVILVTYVPIESGKMIKEGMEVDVMPSTVNREEYGYMLGRVISVSNYASTSESMMGTLQNPSLVQIFSGYGAVMEIQIELLRSITTVSGYRWSTPNGPPYAIDPGTLCLCDIRVSNSRPIEIVMPFLKGILGE